MMQLSEREIARLSPQERLGLIEQLWDSFDDTNLTVSSVQETELAHRLDNLERESAGAVSWEELRSELMNRR